MIEQMAAAIACQTVTGVHKLALLALTDIQQISTAYASLAEVCTWTSYDEEDAAVVLDELCEMGFALRVSRETIDEHERRTRRRVTGVSLLPVEEWPGEIHSKSPSVENPDPVRHEGAVQ